MFAESVTTVNASIPPRKELPALSANDIGFSKHLLNSGIQDQGE
jgi:hypothetical protein